MGGRRRPMIRAVSGRDRRDADAVANGKFRLSPTNASGREGPENNAQIHLAYVVWSLSGSATRRSCELEFAVGEQAWMAGGVVAGGN